MQAHDTIELSVADVYAPGGPVSLRGRNDRMDYDWGRLIGPEFGGKVIYICFLLLNFVFPLIHLDAG